MFGHAALPDDWIDFIVKEWGDRLGKQKRTMMSPDSLNLDYLRKLRNNLPKEYSLERVDLEIAKKLDKGVHRHIAMFFDGSADFVENGIGFCVKHEYKVISIASTYTPYTNKFDIQVDTIDDPTHRRKGLATTVCAALMVYALENNVGPHCFLILTTQIDGEWRGHFSAGAATHHWAYLPCYVF